MSLQFNSILSILLSSMMDKLWKGLTGKTAILVYVILLLLIIIVLVAVIVKFEGTKQRNYEDAKKIYKEFEAERVISTLTRKIEDDLSKVQRELTRQRVTIEMMNSTTSQSTPEPQTPVEEPKPEASQLDELNDEIMPSQTGESRFYMLTQIDKAYENYIPEPYNNTITLKEFCEDFRNFNCNKLNLFYDIQDIRRFVAGLAVTKLIILQGMSGTGKTSLALAFGQFVNNTTTVVPIQPMWKERTDLIGYYNEFTKKFNETTLLYKMYEANNNRDIYCTVLDEMNIARVEYYFAEFLSLLEIPQPEGRNLDVVSDVWENDPKLLRNGKLRLPINMWYVGTANNDDSTFAISDKVYDRAMVINLDKKAEIFDAPETEPCRISVDHLQELFLKAQKEFNISDRNLRRIKKLDKYMIDTFHITFGNRIMKQIRAYVPVVVACGGTELEALDDILSRKILRKLESKNPVYVRAQAESLCNYLDELFGIDKMVLCKETIRTIEQNV